MLLKEKYDVFTIEIKRISPLFQENQTFNLGIEHTPIPRGNNLIKRNRSNC